MLTIKIFLALTSPPPSPSPSSASAFFFHLSGSGENVSCELLLIVTAMFAPAGILSSPGLRFDPLGGIMMSGHDGMQQVQRIVIAQGQDV
jgi:hypothetical protein